MKFVIRIFLFIIAMNVLSSCGAQKQEIMQPENVSKIPSEIERKADAQSWGVRVQSGMLRSDTQIVEQPPAWAVGDDGSGKVLDTGMNVSQILWKIDAYMGSLNARVGTGKLVVDKYSATYHLSESGDTIDLNIDGNASTIEGIRTKAQVEWTNQCTALEKKLDCNGKNNFCDLWEPSKNRICEAAKVKWINCFSCNMDGRTLVDSYYNYSRYDEMLDFSPSGKFLLVHVDRSFSVAEMYWAVLIDTKTGKPILSYNAPFNVRRSTGEGDSGIAYHMIKDNQWIALYNNVSYEWWTPDRNQFIYISEGKNSSTRFLNVTKINEFPSSHSVKLDVGTQRGWNDGKYVYLLNISETWTEALRIFSIADLTMLQEIIIR